MIIKKIKLETVRFELKYINVGLDKTVLLYKMFSKKGYRQNLFLWKKVLDNDLKEEQVKERF